MYVTIAQCDYSWDFATLEYLWLQLSRKKQEKIAKTAVFGIKSGYTLPRLEYQLNEPKNYQIGVIWDLKKKPTSLYFFLEICKVVQWAVYT